MARFIAGFDPIYFQDKPWRSRLGDWLRRHSGTRFAKANEQIVDQVLSDAATGLRMVVNITADALRSVLRSGAYRNIYERPVVGGARKGPSATRARVDRLLGIGADTYFGAVALGGGGVRYYGEYCMVLRPETIPDKTALLDRDSYDLVLSPLLELRFSGRSDRRLASLRGRWGADLLPMVKLRVLSRIDHDRQLVTSGIVSEEVLRDQEFFEVHLKRRFGPPDIEEVRESPDETAIEARILERDRRGLSCTLVEKEWVRRRGAVVAELARQGVRHRVVTLHGRGYQWR